MLYVHACVVYMHVVCNVDICVVYMHVVCNVDVCVVCISMCVM